MNTLYIQNQYQYKIIPSHFVFYFSGFTTRKNIIQEEKHVPICMYMAKVKNIYVEL